MLSEAMSIESYSRRERSQAKGIIQSEGAKPSKANHTTTAIEANVKESYINDERSHDFWIIQKVRAQPYEESQTRTKNEAMKGELYNTFGRVIDQKERQN